MKLFSWVQNKLNGSQTTTECYEKNQSTKSGDQKEEFSDWPNGILSIGTLFHKATKIDTKEDQNDHQENSLTSDQVKQLQKELKSLVSLSDLECLSNSEVDKESEIHTSNSTEANGDPEEESDDDHHYDIVPNKAKDVYLDNNMSNGISKKTLSFLLKKMFVCGGGFAPSPTLRDPTLSPPKTRMNKILRAILRKKIYPQSPCPSMVRKKYLKTGSFKYNDDDDDHYHIEGSDTDKIKWVKTDTEYIVLEI